MIMFIYGNILCGTWIEEFQLLKERETNCMAIKMEIFMHWLNFEA